MLIHTLSSCAPSLPSCRPSTAGWAQSIYVPSNPLLAGSVESRSMNRLKRGVSGGKIGNFEKAGGHFTGIRINAARAAICRVAS